MAERERPVPPSIGDGFRTKAQVMDEAAVQRAIRRVAHEILEQNQGTHKLVIVGLQTGGVPFALALQEALAEIESGEVPFGTLDVAFHRDDVGLRPILTSAETAIPVDLTDRVVVLVDDVIFTGRTIRAALDAIHAFGRPAEIQLAVLVDRGHRELPIRADYVGKNVPTSRDEIIEVRADGVYLTEVSR